MSPHKAGPTTSAPLTILLLPIIIIKASVALRGVAEDALHVSL